ncbi:unnamed protein product [Allacma fusca]|uniref:Uncharacterized protein n=1 Tax=Allacma fusca TaxID=39272 RepID=A0A8J2P1P2_9HEXA|nr:unnamed protein product [Allacma fusca]
MGSNKEVQLMGLLGRHGSYSFFKSIKICGKTYTISSHFPVRIWPDSAILSIAEIQLLWTDRNESLCSLKLYFLPENTPEGRSQHHGEVRFEQDIYT